VTLRSLLLGWSLSQIATSLARGVFRASAIKEQLFFVVHERFEPKSREAVSASFEQSAAYIFGTFELFDSICFREYNEVCCHGKRSVYTLIRAPKLQPQQDIHAFRCGHWFYLLCFCTL